jgi:hypothetical protein
MKLNWALIGSDITAALTTIALIPYDKDTMDIINHLVPPTWVPWIIKAGIAATLLLRFAGRYTQPPPPKP